MNEIKKLIREYVDLYEKNTQQISPNDLFLLLTGISKASYLQGKIERNQRVESDLKAIFKI